MRKPNIVNDVGAWMLENGHRAILKVTGGRYPKKMIGMQPVELFTTGRKSGERRGTLLTAPIYEEGRVVVVASKGGHEHDPQWYKNLVVNPDVEVAAPIGAPARPMRARTASPDEKAELWPTITKVNPGYAGYQKNTDRDIPVVICEPR